jgi:hypothetical protein
VVVRARGLRNGAPGSPVADCWAIEALARRTRATALAKEVEVKFAVNISGKTGFVLVEARTLSRFPYGLEIARFHTDPGATIVL